RQEVRQQRQRRHPRRGRFFLIGCIALLAALAPLGLLAGSSQPFADVDPNSVHYTNIIAIRQAGITNGCNPAANLYCPNNNVTRQEMASFLARTAGIGGNPPVANALTAVAAANADTLNGWSANALVRTNVGENGSSSGVNLTGVYLPLTSVGINVPAPGFVFVSAASSLYVGSSGFESLVAVRLRDTVSGVTSFPLYVDLGITGGTVDYTTLSPTFVFQVLNPGGRSFVVEAGIVSGAGNPNAGNATISALYVPFGPGGFQATGNPEPTEGGWTPPKK
ncbi:MAG: S-layer homology domain-containing protein, partial [Thermomicrobiales bacterium]